MKVDFTLDDTTTLAELRDETCDTNPRASGCSIFAGPADPSQLVGVADANGAFPLSHTPRGAPEMVLSPVSGGAAPAGAADTYGTQTMELADFDNDGNLDVLYGADTNEAARVSLAKPYVKTFEPFTQTTTVAKEENTLDAQQKELENGMLGFLDAMLRRNDATSVVVYDDPLKNPNYPGDGGEDPYAFVNRGPTTQSGNTRPEYDETTAPVVYPGLPGSANATTYISNGAGGGVYEVPTGAPSAVANSSSANVGGAECRAPSESVLPVTVSVQIEFPTVPCATPDFPNCSARARAPRTRANARHARAQTRARTRAHTRKRARAHTRKRAPHTRANARDHARARARARSPARSDLRVEADFTNAKREHRAVLWLRNRESLSNRAQEATIPAALPPAALAAAALAAAPAAALGAAASNAAAVPRGPSPAICPFRGACGPSSRRGLPLADRGREGQG